MVKHAEGARRRGHEKSIAVRYQALDVFPVGVRMAAGNVVFFADRQNAINLLGHDRMFVVARMTELLAQVAFADQDDADAGNFFQNARQVVDGPGFLALDHNEDFAIWRQWPNIGALVIFLLRQPPVARGARRRVAANAGRT